MREHDQRAARRLVAAARLHAHEAVLHQVDAADAVLGADPFSSSSSSTAFIRLPFTETGTPFSKADGHLAGRIGRVGGALGQHPDVVGRGVGGIFERAAFVRDVPDVAVAAVDLGGGREIGTLCARRTRWRPRARRWSTRATARSPASCGASAL
jgi:hypothetical protein